MPITDDQARAIRAGFGRVATGAAVITTLDDGGPHGCTGGARGAAAGGGRPLVHCDGRLRGLREDGA